MQQPYPNIGNNFLQPNILLSYLGKGHSNKGCEYQGHTFRMTESGINRGGMEKKSYSVSERLAKVTTLRHRPTNV